jgi:hypothetical protein
LLPYSSSRLQLPQLCTSISESVAKTKLAPASVEPFEEVAVEPSEELAVELREELAVGLRKEADTEAQPIRVDAKLDTSGS